MFGIIDDRGCGKTCRLLNLAKIKNAKFICRNPYSMASKALGYGIAGIDFVSYDSFLHDECEIFGDYVIDDLIEFVQYIQHSNNQKGTFLGYTLSKDE